MADDEHRAGDAAGTGMSARVDFARLTAALEDYGVAYLITVGDDHRPHTVMVDAVLHGDTFDVGAVGSRTAANVASHDVVTLLWPPRRPGGYALMVDGHAEARDGGLCIVPTKALLHRRATPPSPDLHDCVVFRTP